jgi:hypothetical protein
MGIISTTSQRSSQPSSRKISTFKDNWLKMMQIVSHPRPMVFFLIKSEDIREIFNWVRQVARASSRIGSKRQFIRVIGLMVS